MSSFLEKNHKIYIPGHTGLVGSAVVRLFKSAGFNNLLLKTRDELDLLDAKAVQEFITAEKPDIVIQCAAKVGGILANDTYPAQFLYENTQIQTNIIHSSYLASVKRLLFLGSSCIYPRMCPQPIKEEYLLTGQLEDTNRAYAIAKISGIEMCKAYNKQYGTQFLSVMPTNLYGINDNYHLQNSHVFPAIIRKMHEAKVNRVDLALWGTGSVRREFLCSDDLADALMFLLNLGEQQYQNLLDGGALINIGCGEDLTIKELAEVAKEVIGFEGKIIWDSTKPDGTPQKLLDVSKLFNLGWRPKIALEEGIKISYEDFLRRSTALNGAHK